jgi:hypothetical protein
MPEGEYQQVDVALYQSNLDPGIWSPVFGDPDIARTCDYCGPLPMVMEWAAAEALAQGLITSLGAMRWRWEGTSVLLLESWVGA